jgi:YD repeat-containing protein
MKTRILLFLGILLIAACSKDDETTPAQPGTALVKTITADTTMMASYWYDSQGRLTCSMLNAAPGMDSTVYFYGTNSLEERMYYNRVLLQTEHGIMQNGNLVSINGIKPDSSSYWSVHYTYDADGYLLREIHMDNDTVETWRTEYQVTDGNIVSINQGNYVPMVYTYEYYPGTVNSLGPYNQGTFFGKSSKNLVKRATIAFSSGTWFVEDYAYEYYDNGQVKKMIVTVGSETVVFNVTYW